MKLLSSMVIMTCMSLFEIWVKLKIYFSWGHQFTIFKHVIKKKTKFERETVFNWETLSNFITSTITLQCERFNDCSIVYCTEHDIQNAEYI